MNRYVSIALIITLLTLTTSGAWVAHRISVLTRKGEELTATTQQAATITADWMAYQLGEFQSPEYQKRIKQGFEVGRDASITIAKFNRETIPRVNKLVDAFTETLNYARENNLATLNSAGMEFATLLRRTDASLNGPDGVLPQLGKLAGSLNTTVNDLNADLKLALEAGLTTMETIRTVVSNPRVNALLDEMTGTMSNLKLSFGHVEEGMREFPTLMKLFEKYSKTATRWQRIIYLAQIVNLLGGLPRP